MAAQDERLAAIAAAAVTVLRQTPYHAVRAGDVAAAVRMPGRDRAFRRSGCTTRSTIAGCWSRWPRRRPGVNSPAGRTGLAPRADRIGDGGPVGRDRRAGGDRRVPPGRAAADDPGRLRDRRHLHGGEEAARGAGRPGSAPLAGQPVGPGRGRRLGRPVRRLHRFPAPGAASVRRVRHLPDGAEPRRERLPAVRRRLPDLPGRSRGARSTWSRAGSRRCGSNET